MVVSATNPDLTSGEVEDEDDGDSDEEFDEDAKEFTKNGFY